MKLILPQLNNMGCQDFCFIPVLFHKSFEFQLPELSRQAKINILLKVTYDCSQRQANKNPTHSHKTCPSNTRICKIMSNNCVFWYWVYCICKALTAAEDMLKGADVTIYNKTT